MADFLNRLGSAVAARTNGQREIMTSPAVLRWVREGKVYSGGQGLEATDILGVDTEADTTPSVVLASPASATTLVVPLQVKMAITNDGSGLNTLDVSFTKAAAEVATALALSSGTALNIQNHITLNPMKTGLATLERNVTATALLTTDYITLAHDHAVDAALTSGLPLPGAGLEKVVNLFKPAPIMLIEGAALMVHLSGAATAGNWAVTVTWAELTDEDLY